MKKIIAVLLVLIFAIFLTGCGNMQILDTTFHFDYGTVYSPGGEIIAQGKVEAWRDFEGVDLLQVKIDGITYLTHSGDIILEDR